MFLKFAFFTWAITTAIFLLGAIPYLVWLGLAVYRRQWRKVRKGVMVPACIYVLITSVAVIAGYWEQRTHYDRIFATPCRLEDPLYNYDSARAFNGDGYSISVYRLPDTVRKRFERADAEPLSAFPQRSSLDRDDWDAEPWRRGPVDARFERYVWFALSSYDQTNNRELMDVFAAIRTALAGPDAYYAFFKYDHGDYPGNIDFFLVDLKAGRIYIINNNT